MTEQAVTFHGPDSTILSGILTTADHRAEGQKHQTLPAQRCALLCHGFASHKDGFHFPKLAAFLAKDFGISCLRFDFTGNMDSPGEFRFGGLMQVWIWLGS
jgi:alpha/beta superfamily hydrolase